MLEKRSSCSVQFLKFNLISCTRNYVLSFKDIKLNKSQALPLKSYPKVSGYDAERDTQLG